MFKTILFPLDQSRAYEDTTCQAIELAKTYQSDITLLAVLQPNQCINNQELIASQLKKTQNQIQEAQIKCDLHERQGKPACVICDVANDLNVDLIVLSTKGVNLESTYKSTAARVIELAPCPVLVVP